MSWADWNGRKKKKPHFKSSLITSLTSCHHVPSLWCCFKRAQYLRSCPCLTSPNCRECEFEFNFRMKNHYHCCGVFFVFFFVIFQKKKNCKNYWRWIWKILHFLILSTGDVCVQRHLCIFFISWCHRRYCSMGYRAGLSNWNECKADVLQTKACGPNTVLWAFNSRPSKTLVQRMVKTDLHEFIVIAMDATRWQ